MSVVWSLAAQGIAVILVEHVMTAVRALCHRVIVMNAGAKIAEGRARGGAARRRGHPRLSGRRRCLRSTASTIPMAAIARCNDVAIRVRAGEVVAILGANGAGKTTLLNAIAGLLRPSGGSIRFRGNELSACRPPHRRTGYRDRDRDPPFVRSDVGDGKSVARRLYRMRARDGAEPAWRMCSSCFRASPSAGARRCAP